MPVRSAKTRWTGGLTDGSGQTELVSSGVATLAVSWPKRVSDGAEASTSPEELVAAAHASCYCMALSAEVAGAGGTPESAEVTADVTFAPDPAGGWMISGIHLTVRAHVSGLTADQFADVAEGTKKGCPISKALAVPITLDAALV